MNMRLICVAAVLAATVACGCSNSQPTSPAAGAPAENAGGMIPATSAAQPSGGDADAVRAAIEEHLRDNHTINMAVMDMNVDSVSINGDQAQANAAFHLKQGGTGMSMIYSLERHGNGWLVVHSQPSDGQFIHPPMDKVHAGGATNPAAPRTPDVTDFLKSHPPTDNN
jgi:hypothetical protein